MDDALAHGEPKKKLALDEDRLPDRGGKKRRSSQLERKLDLDLQTHADFFSSSSLLPPPSPLGWVHSSYRDRRHLGATDRISSHSPRNVVGTTLLRSSAAVETTSSSSTLSTPLSLPNRFQRGFRRQGCRARILWRRAQHPSIPRRRRNPAHRRVGGQRKEGEAEASQDQEGQRGKGYHS